MKIWSQLHGDMKQPVRPAVGEVACSGEDKLGVYNGVILYEDARVTNGYNPGTSAAITTARRNVFCGAQAGMVGFGRDNGPNKFTWVEELFDWTTVGCGVGCATAAVNQILQ